VTTPSSAPMPHLDGVRHRDVAVDGFRMHVAEAGEGPPVLLVHGWPQHWYAWRKVIPLLSGERRLLCPDLRGFGWSEAPPGRYDKQRLADDLAALLDALDLESVELVAHDCGAWAGFLLALDHPRRIREGASSRARKPDSGHFTAEELPVVVADRARVLFGGAP